MPSSLSMDAVAAVEDALLRGEWTQALADSRSILGARIVQLEAQDSNGPMTAVEERVLSVYLQAVFELELDDEVETAATIARAFAPLPSAVSLQWSKFLMAMDRRSMAQLSLQELLGSFAAGSESFTMQQYNEAAEALALQLLLPDEGVDAARQFVTGDNVMEEAAKMQLLRRIQAKQLKSQGAAAQSAAPKQVQSVRTGAEQGAVPVQGRHEEESDCSFVIIGGTVIALAVAAAGALRYREKINECLSGVVPAISKGLADAKYALFDA